MHCGLRISSPRPRFPEGGEHTGDLLTPHWQELRPLPVNASHQSLRSRRSQYEFQPFSRSPDFTPRNRSSSPPQSPLGHTPLSGLGIQNLSASRSLPPPVEQNNNSPFTRALPTPPLGMHSGLAQMTIGSTQSLQGTMKSIPIINETEISGSEDGFDTSGLRTTVHISPDNCFVRCPKITFLVDPEGGNDSPGGRALECQICRVSTLPLILRPASSPKIKSDTRPAILPCGHVFGHRCLAKWLRSHDACPCCRLKLRHRGCSHRVEPRVVDSSSIFHLPRTLPDGGVVGDLCHKCREQRQEEAETDRFLRLRKAYKEARDVWRASGDARDHRAMEAARADFEELGFVSSVARLTLDHAEW
ncbi:hypothetical protein PGQ11_007460 [Apiospora arundinis]|uniref:RING-type domain-containing protein n=1 Tax=Apiospora arundinis TaxID=335852 RepID=A0ABR2IVR3_9PEZI